jgi:hypothetical protein
MFRAISCSSSGGQIVLIEHLVSSLSVNDRPVHNTGRSLTVTNDYLLMTVQFVGSHTVKSIIIIAPVAAAAAVQYEVRRGYFVSIYNKFCQQFN